MANTSQENPTPPSLVRLSGAQVAGLCEALLAAFQRAADLEWMVRVRLDTPLHEIASENANLREIVFALVKWAEAAGRLPALIWGAIKERPDNPLLVAFAASVGLPTPSDDVAFSGAASSSAPPPVALASIQPPGGRYDPDWYIPRPSEEDWMEAHLEGAAPVVLQAPRYMGRSWLVARSLERLRQKSPQAALCEINLGRLDGTDFERLARQLAAKYLPRSAEAKARIDAIWDDDTATVEDRVSQVLDELVLAARAAPFVLVYDVPDDFLQGPCWGRFIQLHRTWLQELGPQWEMLRLVFSWSSHPAALGFDTTSQLNREVLRVGDLRPDAVRTLAERHGIAWDAPLAARAQSLCGGHPFLLRQLMLALASGARYDDIERDALADGGVFQSPVLLDAVALLRARPAMLTAVRAVAAARGEAIDSAAAKGLEAAGVFVMQRNPDRWALRYGVYRVLPALASSP